jgi:S1-C subfamily serine protease
MKLSSTISAFVLIFHTTLVNGQDRIEFKGNSSFSLNGVIQGISSSGKVISIQEGRYNRNAKLSKIQSGNWQDLTFNGGTNFKEIACTEFPFTKELPDGKVGHIKEIDFSQKLNLEIAMDLVYNSIKNHGSNATNQNVSGLIRNGLNEVHFSVQLNFSSQNDPVFLNCELTVSETRVMAKTNVFSLYRLDDKQPEVILITEYLKGGKARYFKECMSCNKWISKFEESLESSIRQTEDSYINLQNGINEEKLRQERAKQEVEDLRNYLSTARIHPLEGIWSVDVRIDKGHDFNFTSQAFQIGIKRLGDSFISIPLESGVPQYERSEKVFQRTAEPNVFLMQGYFPDHDYISTATVYQKSDGVVDFSMQLPKAEVRRIAKTYNSTYDGDLKLTYRLIKIFPMPVTDAPKKDAEEPAHWTATGSGFAVSTNGLVATNYHVIEGGKTIYIRGVNGKTDQKLKAEVVANDKQKDLAILRITDKNFTKITELPYTLASTDEKMGAEVFSLGFPKPGVFGDGLIFTDGKVSATKGLLGNEVNYQMTVPITFGNSGGPIFNKLGQVVGISVAGTLDVELLTASYSVKSKYLIDLLKTVTDYGTGHKQESNNSLEEQVEAYKNFVYLIEVSSD